MHTEPIDTERLCLREFREEDLANLHDILANPKVGIWLGKPMGFTFSQSKDLLDRFLQHREERGYGPWALIDKESKKMIGYCGLSYTPSLEETELLYTLHSDFWGSGLITEASEVILEQARVNLALTQVISYTLPHNKASRRVMEKLGMEYIKDFVHADLIHVFYRKVFT